MPDRIRLLLIQLLSLSILPTTATPSMAAHEARAVSATSAMTDVLRFDSPASAQAFSAMDDRVMGGVSRSRVRFDPAGHAVFEGTVSLEQNGGFASVRAALPAIDGEAVRALRLEAMGDGKRYKLSLRLGNDLDGVSYQAAFDTRQVEWMIIDMPLTAFVPSFRGRQVAAPPLDWRAVRQIGLLIADRQAGPFALALRRISLVHADPPRSSPLQ
jgi:NADH dehydrogenase [ubiquinone] 1 alpha subcomplex assembly factor 1